ncbi:hypothetical protein [uncultured Rubinisphaera sp.]|uniref:hypothetical protein n=1 Tax=uncultured Rubinisphaera sp. TaxID=1678686 RepID=UPI0030D7F01C
MLTHKQLDLIRAALQYFDEELSPHGSTAIAEYVTGETVTSEEVTDLRKLLGHCELRYVNCTPDAAALLDTQLLKSPQPATGHFAAVMLLPAHEIPDPE